MTTESRDNLVEQNIADDLGAVSQIDAVPKILEVVCRTTGMGFAAVARVTESRWVACAVRDEIAFGLRPGGELPVATTLCDEVRGSGQIVVIDHVAQDSVYCGHPTPEMYGFQSYISVPIFRPDGSFFGTLCAIDPAPARVNTPETVGMFTLFADLIGFHLDAHERLRASETALLDERETAQLREQFIAVLGHDLRNPLGAVRGGVELLQLMPLDEKAVSVVALIQRSAARMVWLVDNVLDFARGRLGGGLSLKRAPELGLEAVLNQVVAEARAVWRGRAVECDFALARPVDCDAPRVAQMFSNLLGNALTHGDPAGPVRVCARSDEGGFVLSVANAGEPIPPETLERLFRPFTRASDRPGRQGLGLGLYIASEIARAHGGTLAVDSTPRETRFTFRLPAQAA